MKTTHVESMDELVFKNKNKLYGAFLLRRNYNKTLSVALLTGLLIVISAVTYPLIAALLNPSNASYLTSGSQTYEPICYNPEPAPPPPPVTEPVPPAKLRLLAPKIVDNNEIDNDLASQAELGEQPASPPPPDESEASPVTNQPKQVIEIPVAPPEPIAMPEEMPQFPGGEAALFRFVGNNIHYPTDAKQNGTSGTVFVFFIIETDGSISGVTIQRGIGGGCDEEALRVVSMMPRWSPGKQGGIPVRVRYILPVKFILQ